VYWHISNSSVTSRSRSSLKQDLSVVSPSAFWVPWTPGSGVVSIGCRFLNAHVQTSATEKVGVCDPNPGTKFGAAPCFAVNRTGVKSLLGKHAACLRVGFYKLETVFSTSEAGCQISCSPTCLHRLLWIV